MTFGYYVKLYCFTDLNGNVFTWFAGKDGPFQEGITYRLRATVKRHREYRGTKQTEIKRPYLIGVYVEPFVSDEQGKTIAEAFAAI